jgi:hypothetical protein
MLAEEKTRAFVEEGLTRLNARDVTGVMEKTTQFSGDKVARLFVYRSPEARRLGRSEPWHEPFGHHRKRSRRERLLDRLVLGG